MCEKRQPGRKATGRKLHARPPELQVFRRLAKADTKLVVRDLEPFAHPPGLGVEARSRGAVLPSWPVVRVLAQDAPDAHRRAVRVSRSLPPRALAVAHEILGRGARVFIDDLLHPPRDPRAVRGDPDGEVAVVVRIWSVPVCLFSLFCRGGLRGGGAERFRFDLPLCGKGKALDVAPVAGF